MGNELMSLDQIETRIEETVKACEQFAVGGTSAVSAFKQTLALANGVKTLREVFDHPAIKDVVTSMQDTRLGFLTDRSPRAVAQANADGKQLRPYTYAEIKECCIEALLKGYRLNDNEFNVIAGAMYPAKNGKYRKIIEHPGLTDFQFTTTSPVYEVEQKTGSGGKTYPSTFAKVKAFASWLQNGKRVSLGFSNPENGKEDTCVLKIKVNAAMGDDAIIGKALSKLFTRVLMRINGKVSSEDIDVEGVEEIIPTVTAARPAGEATEETPIEGEEIDVDTEFAKIIPEGQGEKVKEFLAMIVKNKGIEEKAVKTEGIKDADGFKKAFLAWANPPEKPAAKGKTKPEPQKENNSVTCPKKKNARVLVALCEKCENQATCVDYNEWQMAQGGVTA